MLIGDTAGFLNVPKIKGIHTNTKSAMLAAETVFEAIREGDAGGRELAGYPERMRASWLHAELKRARNFRPSFHYGLMLGTLYAGLDLKLLRGRAPWTLRNHADHDRLKPAAACKPIEYPKPDGEVSFDRLSSVFLANTIHDEDQPIHLTLRDESVPIEINLAKYGAPEERYCPAGVYEIVRDGAGAEPRLQINAANCVHCKTCDIKDPTQNIDWVVPEGGSGPNYPNM